MLDDSTPGVSVAAVCRRHDIATTMAFRWRVQFGVSEKERAKHTEVVVGDDSAVDSLAPVVLHDLLQPPEEMMAVQPDDGQRDFAPKRSHTDAVLRHILEQEAPQ